MTIISLVSDQPMPNILFIRQMPVADRYVFLTTERMEQEGKADNLVKVCGIPEEKVDYIYCHHEDISSILEEWQELEDRPGEQYHINLTGGTKMMALGTFSFFSSKYPAERVSIYYVPLSGGHIRQMYPQDQRIALVGEISVRDYLWAHGVQLLEERDWQAWASEAQKVFRHVSKEQPDYRVQHKLLEARTNPAEMEITRLSAEERDFYSGKWLEVWLASQVQDLLGVDPSQILWDVKLNRSGAEINQANEYDVIFVRDNRLYLAECKYFTGKSERKINRISKELFKMGGANNLMGLNAKPFFAIVGNLDTKPEDLKEQFRILRIKLPAFLDTLRDPMALSTFLNAL